MNMESEYYSGEVVEAVVEAVVEESVGSSESVESSESNIVRPATAVTVELVVDSDEESMADSEELRLEKERELSVLKEKFAKIEEARLREEEQNALMIQEVTNTFDIFKAWMVLNLRSDRIYNLFQTQFDAVFRSNLFEYVFQNFNDDDLLNDDCMFYLKVLVIDLVRNSKKYKHNMVDITCDFETKTSNLSLVREKIHVQMFH